jgi:hypothetical protein
MGHSQVVKELREQGARTDARNTGGRTPLSQCRLESAVVNELLSPSASNGTTTALGKRMSRGGSNMEAKDNEGGTPLHLASWIGHCGDCSGVAERWRELSRSQQSMKAFYSPSSEIQKLNSEQVLTTAVLYNNLWSPSIRTLERPHVDW